MTSKRSWEKGLKNSKALATTLLKTLISSAFCCCYLLRFSRKESFLGCFIYHIYL